MIANLLLSRAALVRPVLALFKIPKDPIFSGNIPAETLAVKKKSVPEEQLYIPVKSRCRANPLTLPSPLEAVKKFSGQEIGKRYHVQGTAKICRPKEALDSFFAQDVLNL
jgi:hypothetical protein